MLRTLLDVRYQLVSWQEWSAEQRQSAKGLAKLCEEGAQKLSNAYQAFRQELSLPDSAPAAVATRVQVRRFP
jgi:hypothetical protein